MANKEEKLNEGKIAEEKVAEEQPTQENAAEETPVEEKKTWKQKLTRKIPSIMAWLIVGAFAIASLITMIILITI